MKTLPFLNRALIIGTVWFFVGAPTSNAQSTADTLNRDELSTRWTQQKIKLAIDFINTGMRHDKDLFLFKDSTDESPMYDFRCIVIDDTLRPVANIKHAHFESAVIENISCKKGTSLEGIKFTDAELHTVLFEGVNLSKANFAGCTIRTARMKGANLENANLMYAELRGADFDSARLLNVELYNAEIDSACLKKANLSNTNMTLANCNGANFQGSNLLNAQMIKAELWDADLQGANLFNVNFQGAYLSSAKVRDADFFGARFDSTRLSFTNLGEAKVRYILWGANHHKGYTLGEENDLWTETDHSKRELLAQIVEDTYRDLESIYRAEGRLSIADEFHYRQNDVLTRNYASWNPLKIIRIVFLQWTYGYGSRPFNLFLWTLSIILIFTFIFAFVTLTKSKSGIYIVETNLEGIKKETLLEYRNGLLFFDCLYFSVLSFSAFGYGAIQPKEWLEFFRTKPVEFKAVSGVRIFVGIEAVLGIYTFALFVTAILKGG